MHKARVDAWFNMSLAEQGLAKAQALARFQQAAIGVSAPSVRFGGH